MDIEALREATAALPRPFEWSRTWEDAEGALHWCVDKPGDPSAASYPLVLIATDTWFEGNPVFTGLSAAVNNLPSLLSELSSRRGEVERLRAALQACERYADNGTDWMEKIRATSLAALSVEASH